MMIMIIMTMMILCCTIKWEEETGCCGKTHPLVVGEKTTSSPHSSNYVILSYGLIFKKSILRGCVDTQEKHDKHFLLKKQKTNKKQKRINSTDYLVAKDKIKETPMLSEVAQNFLSEIKGGEKRRGSASYIEHVTCCTVCFVRRCIYTKRTTTLLAELAFSPPPPSFQTNRWNNWKTDCFSS